MQGNSDNWLAIAWEPQNDGQGYHVTPGDSGGATNEGSTYRYWEPWAKLQGKPSDLATFRTQTQADMRPFLVEEYWDQVRGNDLPAGLDMQVSDAAMMSGVPVAKEQLQRALGVQVDGHIGPHTLLAAKDMPIADAIGAFTRNYLAHLAASAGAREFDAGWSRRAEELREKALQLAGVKSAPAAPAAPAEPAQEPAAVPDESETEKLNDEELAAVEADAPQQTES